MSFLGSRRAVIFFFFFFFFFSVLSMLDDMFCDDALVLFVVWYSSFDGVFISNMGGTASYSGLRKKEKKIF